MTRSQAIDRLIDVMRRKHMALSTRKTYSHWVGRFAGWLAGLPADQVPDSPAGRMEAFLTDLARSRVSASTQNQAFNALLFFYRQVLHQDPGDVDALRARRPRRMRHAPTRQNVRAVLAAVRDTPAYPYRLITQLLYGCGLRVSEPLGIRIRDLDLDHPRPRVIIREAKGDKDRLVPLPTVLIPDLHRQVGAARFTWERARAEGDIPVAMPGRLGRKYRAGSREFPWFWLFPAANACAHPDTDELVWWHCLPTGVQKAVARAARETGLTGSLSPHHLRHAWATHALDAGANVRDLQEILGHKSLETTMDYAHPQVDRVPSPLDTLAQVA